MANTFRALLVPAPRRHLSGLDRRHARQRPARANRPQTPHAAAQSRRQSRARASSALERPAANLPHSRSGSIPSPGPRFTSRFRRPSGETFSVVTFNIQGTNEDLEQATRWLLQTAPDLIIMQETAEGYDARLAPLYDCLRPRRPSRNQRPHLLPTCPSSSVRFSSSEDDPGREALRLVVDHNGRELAVYAVHMTLPLKPRLTSRSLRRYRARSPAAL